MTANHNKHNDNSNDIEKEKWKQMVLNIIQGSSNNNNDDTPKNKSHSSSMTTSMNVKEVRRLVFLSMQIDDDDNNKQYKKLYKHTIQSLEKDNIISLDSDGTLHHIVHKKDKKKKKKQPQEENENKKRKRDEAMIRDDDQPDQNKEKSKVTSSTKMDNEKGIQKDREKKEKKNKKEKKEKKQRTNTIDDDGTNHHDKTNNDSNDNHDEPSDPNQTDNDNDNEEVDPKTKNKPCEGNLQGITRLFLGNLPFSVDETILGQYIPGITHIKWITDKDTGQFYGSAFVEMKTSQEAAAAVKKSSTSLMGRPIKINYAPARPNEVWPPSQKVISGGNPQQQSQPQKRQQQQQKEANDTEQQTTLGPPPDGCKKLFLGNLSYQIDDETIHNLFRNVDADVKAIRWIHHKDSGDFKGVGFVEFWNSEACIRAATLNGKNVLGRPIRMDWTD